MSFNSQVDKKRWGSPYQKKENPFQWLKSTYHAIFLVVNFAQLCQIFIKRSLASEMLAARLRHLSHSMYEIEPRDLQIRQ